MSQKVVAIVEDEADIRELVETHLHQALFQTVAYENGSSFLTSLARQIPDLVILDLMLPDMDGLDVCRFLKNDPRWATIPVLMLTAKATETDKVVGLEVGADDYVIKPFSPLELVARVKALLRRATLSTKEKIIRLGNLLTLNVDQYQVTVQGKQIHLTASEFRILQLLASSPGRVFTRKQILDFLWGQEKAVIDRTVDVHIMNLREKLGVAGSKIKGVRGIGYKLEAV
ncbi:MAG: response regulator transcription factor [Candidatus Omnitrophica bacterium]|nr:response regulator transcription factor [Candidatus Omnitrophota bacterium]